MIITTLTEPSGVPRRIGRLVGDFLRAPRTVRKIVVKIHHTAWI